MGRASARVYVDGLVCVLDICKERAVAEHMHRDFVFEEYPVWIQVSGAVLHVVRDLMKSRAWCGLGVVVGLVVGLGVVFYISVALFRFVVDVHA